MIRSSRRNRDDIKPGYKNGRWTVVGPYHDSGRGDGSVSFPCQCECGTERSVMFRKLNSGSQSCGCLQRELLSRRQYKHGLANDPAHKYELEIQRKYGLSMPEWTAMFDKQDGKCRICLRDFSSVRACVDHDHVTGIVRGLLCYNCNLAIAHLGDDPANMIRAFNYLSIKD